MPKTPKEKVKRGLPSPYAHPVDVVMGGSAPAASAAVSLASSAHSLEMKDEDDSTAKLKMNNPNQRHKKEWNELRQTIFLLKKDKSKLRKADLSVRGEKKDLGSEIKRLEREFKERTEREMKEYFDWKAQHEAKNEKIIGGTNESSE